MLKDTAKRICDELPFASIRTHVTNQEVGARADDLPITIRREYSLQVDIQDRNWFLERASGEHREEFAEPLATDVVDPYLESRRVISRLPKVLSSIEASAAHLFLTSQWKMTLARRGSRRSASKLWFTQSSGTRIPDDRIAS